MDGHSIKRDRSRTLRFLFIHTTPMMIFALIITIPRFYFLFWGGGGITRTSQTFPCVEGSISQITQPPNQRQSILPIHFIHFLPSILPARLIPVVISFFHPSTTNEKKKKSTIEMESKTNPPAPQISIALPLLILESNVLAIYLAVSSYLFYNHYAHEGALQPYVLSCLVLSSILPPPKTKFAGCYS